MSSELFPAHREYVGRPDAFDSLGASHFTLLTMLGLREHHRLLDVGCGSLRSGRLLIVYLQKGHYFGIDPNEWLVRDGLQQELSPDLVQAKMPSFDSGSDFVLTRFGCKFDFIHAHSVLTHAAPWMIERLFEQIKQVMEPNGVFAGTINLGEEDHAGQEWIYPGQVSYRPGTIEAMAARNGLSVYRLTWPHPSQKYILLLHQERGLTQFLDSINGEHLLPVKPLIERLSA